MTSPADEPAASQYFSDQPSAASRTRLVSVRLPDVDLELQADTGVFSADRLDPGTKLLLLEAPSIGPSERSILDLGCGWGPIACVTARRAPHARVWAVDVNPRARHLTAANAAAIGVEVEVARPEDVPAELRFDRILSNPPIRVGKAALYSLLGSWLDRLGPSGRAHLVVQRHLGSDSLASWLERRGHPVTRLRSRAGYRLLEVEPTEAGAAP